MKKIIYLLTVLLMFFFENAQSQVGAQESLDSKKIVITSEEKAWIKDHPIIKVGNDREWPPFDFYEKGKSRGYNMDLIRVLSEIIGIQVEFVQDESWDALTEQFRQKKLDVLTAYEITDEHNKHALFTEPFLNTLRSIVIRRNAPFLKNYKDLYGKRVAVVSGYDYEEILSKYHPEVQMILVDTPIDGLKKLSFGEVDAFVENSAVASYLIKTQGFPNLEFAGNPDFPEMEVGEPIRIAIRKDWPLLHSLFSKALVAIPDATLTELRDKWLGIAPSGKKTEFRLTDEEASWLESHSEISVAVDASWAPIEFIDDEDRFQGLTSEYLKIIEGKLKVRFKYQPFIPWKLGVEEFKNKKIDIVSSMAWTKEREKFSIFTSPYISMPISIFSRKNVPYIGSLENLNGQKVGVVLGSAIQEWLENDYPEIQLLKVDSVSDGLNSLSKQEIYAMVGNLGAINYYIEKNQVDNVRNSGNTEYSYDITMAIRNDLPELAVVIQKAMDSISKLERETIFNKWMSVRFEYGVDYKIIQWVIIISLIALVAFFYWNRLLERQVRNRTLELSESKEMLQELNTNLEDIVRRRTSEYEHAMQMAENANRAKSNFLANMSHEIRTPMNAVIGMTHLALKSGLNRRQESYVKKAHQSAKSLLGIINDILDYSKIESGKLEIESIDFSLNEVIKNVLSLVHLKSDDKGIKLEVKIDRDVPRNLTGDPLRISQILINLANNAVKFSENGETVILKIQLKNTNEDIITLHFSVIDTGIGLTEDQIGRLFQAFSQADNSTSRQYGGTGLGLTISKQLTELMNGEIWVESTVGQGSTFHFTVVLKKRSDEEIYDLKNNDQKQELLASLEKLRGARVLLVEDNEINQELATELLINEGITVISACDGLEALGLLDQQKFDGILMDCQMPRMDGYEATRKIREQDQFSNLPIIAMTANAMKHDIENALRAGMNDHIAKPIDPDVMFITMAKWIKPS